MNPLKRFRLPSLSQWQKLPAVLSPKERKSVLVLSFALLVSGMFLLNSLYVNNTEIVPRRGGSIEEGMVGAPRFLNPVLSDANDADRDLVQLLFAGIMKYNKEGELVGDLAKEVSIEDGGKVYEVTLKDNLLWSDGASLSAEDIAFTVGLIQDPKYKSPVRANWIGVQVEQLSPSKVRFRLQQPYAPFLERLTLKPIPAHIWKDISPENFAFSNLNLQPVGSGPYRVAQVIQHNSGPIEQLKLSANLRFHEDPPFIPSLSFRFYGSEKELRTAFQRGEVRSFSLSKAEKIPGVTLYRFTIPRYFAVFFNLASPTSGDPVKEKGVRQALELATDNTALVQDLFGEYGRTVRSPLLPEIYGLEPPQEQQASREEMYALLEQEGYILLDGKVVEKPQSSGGIARDLDSGSQGVEVRLLQECLARDPKVYPEGTVSGIFGPLTKQAVTRFQEKYAQEILAPLGLQSGTGKAGPSTREKLNELCFTQSEETSPLTITLHTIDRFPLKEAALILQKQWKELGIALEVKSMSPAELERDVIKPRNYQALLFGEILGKIPDPFPFWHSSQKRDPGLNLSSYDNRQLDTLLEQARRETSEEDRKKLYQQMQKILLEDVPALLIFDLEYLYAAPSEVKGIEQGLLADPSWRFANANEWYIKTKRAFK